ncbi:MAG: hypothetical protein DMF72_21035 [Acidobacteria bacterium]|nr:MAG: hypothetical protein DMF72_21035 [Acidobacteriota bacterium]
MRRKLSAINAGEDYLIESGDIVSEEQAIFPKETWQTRAKPLKMMTMPTILIVDDDAVIRGLLFDLLSEQYECNTASTAEEALAFLEFETYDVVVTDIAMTGLDGIDLLRRVQRKNPKTPVILISGKGNEHNTDSFLEMGAFAYVKKPFTLDEIEEVIWRAVASTA